MGTITLAKFSDIVGIDTKIGNTSALTSPSTTNIVNAINSIDTIGNTGTKIPLNANLNDYTTLGIYWTSADIVSSLVNAPLDLTYHESADPLYDQYEDFKMIVSKLWEGTQVGTIRQEIFAGLGGETTANFGKRWERFYDIQTQTWGKWFIYLTALEDTATNFRYMTPSMGGKVYDFGINGIKIKRNQDHTSGYIVASENLELGSTARNGAGGGVSFRDSNNEIFGYYLGGINSSGNAYTQMYAQNSNGSSNSLTLTKEEDGTNTVAVTSPAAWRAGIQAAPNPTIITIANNTSHSIANSSNTNHSKVTLTPGVWLLTVRGSFASSSVGRRAIFLSTSSTGGAMSSRYNTNQQATNGATTVLGWTAVMQITANSTYYINGYQNSGSALNLTLFAQKTKLGDA